jgi:hypothetical protein
MYNLYVHTELDKSLTDNNGLFTPSGTFTVNYNTDPLLFERGSKIALLNMLVWNSVNNISVKRQNNFIYISVKTGANKGQLPSKGSEEPVGSGWYKATATNIKNYNDYNDVWMRDDYEEGSDNYEIFKIQLPDGQYDAETLDSEIAHRLQEDLENSATNDIDDDNRTFQILADYTFSKFKFLIERDTSGNNIYDILFPVVADDNTIYSGHKNIQFTNTNLNTNMAKILGLNKKKDGIAPTKKTFLVQKNDGTSYPVEYYSYDASRGSDDSGLAYLRADINNGINSFNLRIAGGLYDGGNDGSSGMTDIIYSFNMTVDPSFSQDVSPRNLIWLDILKVDQPINQLTFKLTDQKGNDIGKDLTEGMNLVFAILEPQDVQQKM